jgi:hypothetical protein
MPETEAEWQAEDDARALAQAEEIKSDKPRMDKARDAAKKMADEEAERARAMRKVAGQRTQHRSDRKQGEVQKPVNRFNVFEKL